jgi:DNA-directed RNA polymerase I, II, and III subunit RPABC1
MDQKIINHNNSTDVKVRRTVYSMIKNRNYTITEQETYDNPRETIIAVNNLMDESEPKLDDHLIVFFSEDDKIGVRNIREYYEIMQDHVIHKAIIIYKQNVTASATTEAYNLQIDKDFPVFIQLFQDTSLIFDITTHELVPKHELLSAAEAELLCKKFDKSQLPQLKSIDPVCRYYDFPVGSIVKIIRPSETSGIYENYRLVVRAVQ